MRNVLGAIAGVILFFTPWALFGSAGSVGYPWSILVFFAGIVVMSLTVPLPLWVLDRIERRRAGSTHRLRQQSVRARADQADAVAPPRGGIGVVRSPTSRTGY